MPLVYTFSRARPAALVNLFHNYSAADARSLHAALSPRDQDLKSSDTGATSSDILQQAEVKEWITTRQNAIRERQPNYAGWWTEILNYRQAPQTLPDPTLLLSGDHVFQGRPAVIAPSNTPTATEVKKGYANSLPSATSASPGNTLPTAASHGSTTFATGTVSSLSRSSTESTDYHGFAIPIKPSPPGAEDCCMSGCAHCIYDIYEDDRQEYKQKLASVLADIERAGLAPPPNLKSASKSKGSGTDSKDDEDSDMDSSMRAFLELERKLKGA